jgi:molybdate transport system substrate-binding protein
VKNEVPSDWWLVTGRKTNWRRWVRLLPLILSVFPAEPEVRAQGQEIRIAAAADMKFAVGELSERFEKQAGTKVNVTYGSSGNFFSQMRNGAPFDLFFSADFAYPKKLEEAGFAEPGTLYEYAIGRIAVWTRRDAKVDVTRQGWKALLDASVRKIAIANPEHAPYGRAAVAALKEAGIYESVRTKLVYGENIAQAAQFVQSGNAQAGIVAMSLAVSPAMRDGKRWEIPEQMHPAIEQGAIILKDAKNKEAARAFLEFVKSAAGRAILAKYGFALPETAGKGEKR